MASLPGMPGSLGIQGSQPLTGGSGSTGGGSDGTFDLPSPSGITSSALINRTIFHAPGIGHGSVSIPPTTEGNTLVVVQMGATFVSRPVFNDVMAGYPIGHSGTPINTSDNGFSGAGDEPGFNSGSEIGYFTNIAGGITTVDYPSDFHGANAGYIPTIGIVYEFQGPCPVVALLGTADIPDATTTPPDLVAYAIAGPDAGGFYISSILATDDAGGSGAYSSVNAPWVFDYQESQNLPTIFIAGAVAIIEGGAGTQQATFSWGGSATGDFYYGATSIVVLPGGGTTPTPSLGDLDQFLPNVWVVS